MAEINAGADRVYGGRLKFFLGDIFPLVAMLVLVRGILHGGIGKPMRRDLFNKKAASSNRLFREALTAMAGPLRHGPRYCLPSI